MNNDFGILKDWILRFKGWWAGSLAVIIAFLLGLGAGILTTEGRIINDCKYINNFRVDSQGYQCIRKI